MAIIAIDGIVTSGKTCFGNVIVNWLSSESEYFTPIYFNDTIRARYGLDTLALKKDPKNRDKITKEQTTAFLSYIVTQLQAISKSDKKNYIFVMDRLHYSYMDSLNATSKDFMEFEKKIKDSCYYICLNFKNPNPEQLYSRIKQSLTLRNDHPFTLRHFDRLVGDITSEDERREKIWEHYGHKIETYNRSFKDSILDKSILFVDDIIHKDDYPKLLTQELQSNIWKFLDRQ